MFQKELGRAGDNKVIRIAHQMDLGLAFARRGEVLGQQGLQTIQGAIGQDRRDNPALGCPGRGRVHDAFFQVARCQPATQDVPVHGDVFQQPDRKSTRLNSSH